MSLFIRLNSISQWWYNCAYVLHCTGTQCTTVHSVSTHVAKKICWNLKYKSNILTCFNMHTIRPGIQFYIMVDCRLLPRSGICIPSHVNRANPYANRHIHIVQCAWHFFFHVCNRFFPVFLIKSA